MPLFLVIVVSAVILLDGAYLAYLDIAAGSGGPGILMVITCIGTVIEWLRLRAKRPDATDLVDRALINFSVILLVCTLLVPQV